MKRIIITQNRSLDGVLYKLNTKNIKDGVNLAEINDFSDSEYDERKDQSLPGASNYDVTKRKVKMSAECRDLRFSPGEDSW